MCFLELSIFLQSFQFYRLFLSKLEESCGPVLSVLKPKNVLLMWEDIFLFILEKSHFHVICVRTLANETTFCKTIWSKSTMFRFDFVVKNILESLNKTSQNSVLSYFRLQIVPIKVGKDLWLCPVCSKSMKNKTNMQRHILVHTGEKPHFCNDCSYSSSRSDKLKEHVKSKHNCWIKNYPVSNKVLSEGSFHILG